MTQSKLDENISLVEISVLTPGHCRVMPSGGSIIVEYPAVLKSASGPICINALASCAEAIKLIANQKPTDTSVDKIEVTCDQEGCETVFCVKIADVDKEALLTTKAPPPPSEGKKLTSLAKSGGPFLSRLDDEVIEELVDISNIRTYTEPTEIIRLGQEGQALFIVADGEVSVIRTGEDGRDIVLATPGKGACLGEMSILTGQPAAATVKTGEDVTTILEIERDELTELLGREPVLHREFSRIIAERLYSTNVKLEAERAHGISGQLSMIGIVDLVQTLNASCRTGTLNVHEQNARTARVGFKNGAVVAATLDDIFGPDAFFNLLEWSEGNFSFESGEPESLEEIDGAKIVGTTMSLLMEGMRRIDEKERS